jgi:hypothetical protein
MQFLRFAFLVAVAAIFQAQFLSCQQAESDAKKSPPPPLSAIDNDFVKKQFGSSCALIGMPPLVGDLNGDGIDDVVIPARCKNPMSDQTEDNFTVMDPYYTFFGYGNPKVTSAFSGDVPTDRGLALLVIHGSGAETWNSPTPSGKFVIVNLPFKQVTVKKLMVKKKKVMAIYLEETGADQMTSALYWDGKKYHYEPMGASME